MGDRHERIGAEVAKLTFGPLEKTSDADIIDIGRDPLSAHHGAGALGASGVFEAWPGPYGWWLEKCSSGFRAIGERPAA